MTLIQLTGRITAHGKLEVELPVGLPQGEVQVTVELATESTPTSWNGQTWSAYELEQLLIPEPKTGIEIARELKAGLLGDGWSHIKVSGAEWVEDQRRRDRARNAW